MAKNKEDFDRDEFHRLENMMAYEEKAYQLGYQLVAGIDEAGRGPLAGPVVAAVCLLPKTKRIFRINDSKKLNSRVRADLFKEITQDPTVKFAFSIVDSEEIDRINIYQATIVAMVRAVKLLEFKPEFLLVDGLDLKHHSILSEKIIKGDQLSQSIAAASIIAKETRDHLMLHYHQLWPQYGFDQHKGYGTKQHREALKKFGMCPIHRRTFKLKENLSLI